MSVKKRENFLDRLRVAATCAVVLLHTVTGIMDVTDMSRYRMEKRFFLVVLDLVCWCVPVFVLISGYLFLNPERELPFRQMLTKYCRRILLALFLFGIPYACMELVAVEKTFRPGMILESILMVLQGRSWSHLWYLYLVLLLYLLTPAIKYLLKKVPLSAVYVFLAVLLLGSSILPFVKKLLTLEWMHVLPDGGIYFFYYICGYLFAIRGRKLSAEEAALEQSELRKYPGEQKRPGNDCMFAVPVVILAIGMTFSRIFGEYKVQMAYNYPFTVALALILFSWGLTCQKNREPAKKSGAPVKKSREPVKRNTGFWEKAGALCFAVYLIHPVFLNIYYKFLHISPLDFSVWVSLPVFFLAAFLPAVFVAWILRKVPVLKKYVL